MTGSGFRSTKLQTVLYVVHFSDDRIKVGISADVIKRMAYYRQEARRNNVNNVVWWASVPFDDKAAALLAERILCRTYAEFSVPHHREWFRADPQGFAGVISTAEDLRGLIGTESEEIKTDLPFMGSTGYFLGLASAA